MANVQFLRGNNDALQKILKKANGTLTSSNYSEYYNSGTFESIPNVQEGAFYLTTDTHRLYTGISDGVKNQLIELNKSIYEVDVFTDLTGTAVNNYTDHPVWEEGQFAFVKSINALAVYKNNTWTQINPDTHLLVNNNHPLFGVTPNNNENPTSVTIAGTIKDTIDGTNAAHTLTDNITLSVTGDLTLDVNDKVLTLGYTAPAASRVSLSASDRTSGGNTIGIDLKTNQDGQETGTVSVEAGDNVSITKDSNIYKINANNMYTSSLTGSSLGTNGSDYPSSAAEGFKISLEDGNHSGSNALKAYLNPAITVKDQNNNVVTGGGTHFVNGTAALDVYDRTAVNNLITAAKRDIDAMTYKGTISNSDALDDLIDGTTPSSIGDTYKVSTPFTSSVLAGEVELHAGDLIICKSVNGNEVEGIINTQNNNFAFDVVQSGNDYTYAATYSGSGDTRTIALNENLMGGSSSTPVMNLSITAGNNLSLDTTQTNGNITINHDTITTPAAAVSGYTVPNETYSGNDQDVLAITSLTLDNYGHVTNFGIKNYKTTDTHTTLSSVENTVNVANNVVTQNVKVTADHGEAKQQSYTMNSNTLTFSASGQALTLDLQWGSF